jgi:hypothetical protein
MRTWLMIPVWMVLQVGGAAADEAAPPPAAGNGLAGVNFEKYEPADDRETPVEAGQRFLADLGVASPEVKANVTEAVRYELQKDETDKFARQKKWVLRAYGVAWSLLAVFGVALFMRHQKLAADLAALEARVGSEKK